MVQRNAIQSWKQLGGEVTIALIGEEDGVEKATRDFGAQYIPEVCRNAQGTPLTSSIFELSRTLNSSPLLGYINADVIVLSDFLETAEKVDSQCERFLLAGQRWDLKVESPLRFKTGWEEKLKEDIVKKGKRHPPAGSDYFIFPRECFHSIPDFAIGRAGWDNWMIFKARWEGWKMIDASDAITVVHQDHDYSHLPKGQTHHKLPETFENVKLAGGKRTIFTLNDADYSLDGTKISRAKPGWKRFLRGIETFPLIKLHSFFLANITFGFMHPMKAYQEFRSTKSLSKKDLSMG
jgi:hypothetical protein